MALGLANGAFAISAIASMMELGGRGGNGRDGLRIGLWGAAQAVAFAFGGFAGALCVDLARAMHVPKGDGYALVLAVQSLLFIVAAVFASRVGRREALPVRFGAVPAAEVGPRA